jgi:hypothetical protein
LSSVPEAGEIEGRFIVPAVRVVRSAPAAVVQPICIELLPFGAVLTEQLCKHPQLLYELTPEQFEEFVCEQLFAMGFEPKRIGNTNQTDGGIDILFWPRMTSTFPVLGAAQVKHHRTPNRRVAPTVVRDFAAVLSTHPVNAGLLVTNTSFTASAEWFAHEHAKLMRLRRFEDIRRWLAGNFTDEAEWREMPKNIEVAPGVVVPIRRGAG